MHLRSRVLPWVVAAAVLLARSETAGGWDGQTGPNANAPQATPQQSGQPAVVTQPSLTVDRDPVASPDPDTPAAASTSAAARRRRRGRDRLSARAESTRCAHDAYEVRLNATVLDSEWPVDSDARQG